jgi:hypothetical protein
MDSTVEKVSNCATLDKKLLYPGTDIFGFGGETSVSAIKCGLTVVKLTLYEV